MQRRDMAKTISILLGGDVLIALLANHLGLVLQFGRLSGGLGIPIEFLRILPFAGVLLLTGFLTELYSDARRFRRREAGVRILASLLLAFLLLTLIYDLVPAIRIGGDGLLLSLAAFGLAQFLWHCRFPLLLRSPAMARRVLVLGAGPLARQMAALIEGGNNRYVFAGYIGLEGDPRTVPADEILGTIQDLGEATRQHRVNQIVVSLTERRGVLPVRDVLTCKLRGIEILDAMTFYERVTGKLLLEKINPSWFIFSDGFRLTPFMRVSKRLVDVVFALTGLVLALPMLPLLALAVRLDSPGPVLFRQLRVGEGERPFFLYKFRSMRQDAEKDTGAVWAQENDPRVTRLGRFLRKTRLDEIPQLFNVLKGEMSFVGPRPERPEFVEGLKERVPYYANRHCVKPGVTGWAQVKFPYGASEEDALEKLRYDLYYIKNYSLFLDLSIVFGTVRVVLGGRGGR